jgi:hypothetical protein
MVELAHRCHMVSQLEVWVTVTVLPKNRVSQLIDICYVAHQLTEMDHMGGGEVPDSGKNQYECIYGCPFYSPERKGECEAESEWLPGEPVKDDDEEPVPDRGCPCGLNKVTDGEVNSGSSSSRIRCSSREMVSRNICVLVLPLPSSYSHASDFFARQHC